MARINFANREITAKIVYYGAGSVGCATNLRQLHRTIGAEQAGQLHRFGTSDPEEQTLYFDHVVDATHGVRGFELRLQIYSLSDKVRLPAHREEVIRDVDGLVFVATAVRERSQDNMMSMLELERTLARHERELASVPVVIQVNGDELADEPTAADVVFDLNPYGFPVVSSVAARGEGVMQTHDEIASMIGTQLRDALTGRPAPIQVTATFAPHVPSSAERIAEHLLHIDGDFVGDAHLDAATVAGLTPPPVLEGPEVELPFLPRELVGSRAIKVLGHQIEADGVRVELVMQHMGATERRRLTLMLANRPADADPVPAHAPPKVESESADRVRDFLPETITIGQPAPVRRGDLSPVLYGFIGVFGGVLIGLLMGYLLGLIG